MAEPVRIPNGTQITFDDMDWIGIVLDQIGFSNPETAEVLVTIPGPEGRPDYGWIKRSAIVKRHVRGHVSEVRS